MVVPHTGSGPEAHPCQEYLSEIRAQMVTCFVALLLSTPVALGEVRGLVIVPTYFLIPLIAWSFLRTFLNPLNVVFACAVVGGIVSIVVTNVFAPGTKLEIGSFTKNLGELLMWNLFAPSFLFLGRSIAVSCGLKRACLWLASCSCIFILAIATPLLISGAPVRATNADGTSFINVSFFCWPIFATYGVNSLAPMFCLQAALLCAGIYSGPKRLVPFFALGLACATFLAIKSESRASQLCLVLMVCLIAWFIYRRRPKKSGSLLVLLALCSAIGFVSVQGRDEYRLVTALRDASGAVSGSHGSKQAGSSEIAALDNVSTGRIMIWSYAFKEWLENPITGNGFSTFGRYGSRDIPESVSENTTAHLFYLNALWKGGIIFFVPLVGMIFLAFRYAWAYRTESPATVRFFFTGAVLMAFSFPSLTWDFLLIPTGGALAWFLLGALTVQAVAD